MEVYKVLIDLRKLISSGRVQINDIEEEGVANFLQAVAKTDLSIIRTYKRLVDLSVDMSMMRPGSKLEELKEVLNYDSYEDLKKDLIYLPGVNHNKDVFEKTKQIMEQIYKDNPDIFYDIMEKNGLSTTINSLVEKYNVKTEVNQNA